MTNPSHVKTHNQGEAYIRRSKSGKWLVLTPDGEFDIVATRDDAIYSASAWFKRHAKRKGEVASVGVIREMEECV